MAASTSAVAALLDCHRTGDSVRFWAIAKQIVALERKNGHEKAAQTLELAIAKASGKQMQTLPFKPGVDKLLTQKDPNAALEELVAEPLIKDTIRAFVYEYRRGAALEAHGIRPRRKVLLYGHSGTGKTMTANIIARELELPFIAINTAQLVGSHLGETGRHLDQVFEAMQSMEAVYLFDEADSLFAAREHDQAADREMSRAVNSLLQFMEQWANGVMVCATNLHAILDTAFHRRFDVHLKYTLPTHSEAAVVFKGALERFGLLPDLKVDMTKIISDMSHAEIRQLAEDAARALVLYHTPLLATLEQRRVSWE